MASRQLTGSRTFVICLATVLIQWTAVFAAAGLVPTPIDDGKDEICETCGQTFPIAVTNGVPTTIHSPKNIGGEDGCTFTLVCHDAEGNQVGIAGVFEIGDSAHSFSCGSDAHSIAAKCDDDGNDCKIQFQAGGGTVADPLLTPRKPGGPEAKQD